MTLLRLTLVSSLALLTSTAAYAQPVIDQAGADVISQQINKALNAISPTPLADEIKALPEGDHYTVTLQIKPLADKDVGMTFAPLTLKLTPQDNGNFAYNGSIPNPMVTITTPKGEPLALVTAESQKIEGVWDLEHHIVLQDRSSLSQIQLTDNKGAKLLTISSFNDKLDSSFTADGKLNSVMVMGLRQISATDPESGLSSVKIDGLGFAGRSFGVDIAAMQAVRDKMQQNISSSPRSDEAIAALSEGIRNIFSASGQSDGAFVLNNMNIHVDDAETGSVDVKLPLLKASISAMEADAISLDYQHKGMQVAPLPSPLLADLLPQDTQFNLLISHIPYAKLMDSLALLLNDSNKVLQEAEAAKHQSGHKAQHENGPEKMATSPQMDDLLAIKKALIEAGTTLDIMAFNFTAKSLSLASTGSFKAALSPLAVTGNYTGRVSGLSELVERLSMQAPAPVASDKPQPQENPIDQGALMFLSMAQAMGEPVKGSNPSTLIYSVDLTPEGALMLNGSDLGLFAPTALPEGPAPNKFAE